MGHPRELRSLDHYLNSYGNAWPDPGDGWLMGTAKTHLGGPAQTAMTYGYSGLKSASQATQIDFLKVVSLGK